MIIAIPSRGRPNSQITYNQIPREYLSKTFIVVPKKEEKQYRSSLSAGANILPRPRKLHGISNVRQWILEEAGDEFVFFMDDDLKIEARTWTTGTRLKPARLLDVSAMFRLMENWLKEDHMGAVGLSSRFGNVWIKESYVECSRPCMAYGVSPILLRELGIKFNEVEVCEDYHVMISLLKAGYKNRMTANYVVSDSGVGKSGGITDYRTKEMVLKNMKKMVELHAPYVSLRKVKGKTQGLDIGVELRVQWRKAYNDSKKVSLV